MAFQSESTGHHSRPPSRRTLLIGIAVMAATLALAACGGGMSVTTAPVATTAAAIASATPVAISGRQGGSAPTSAPAATVSPAAPRTVPTTPPTTVAPVAAAATKPPAAPNANTGSAVSKVDACTLVTKADYLAVLGDAANDPVMKNAPLLPGIMRSSCEYKIASADKVEFVTVTVMQRDPSVPAQIDMKTYWEGTKKAWTNMQEKVTPLPEIGPEVFLVVNPTLEQIGAGGGVHFFKGDVIFDVQAVTGSGTVDGQNTAGTVATKKLATIAFGRL